MKKGFTLVELLAVIVILAVISIITIPLIGNVIEDSKKKALEQSVYGLVEAANYFTISNDGIYEFVFDESKKGETTKGDSLDYNGEIDAEGKLYIDNDGNVSLCLENEKYYVYKNYNSGIYIGEMTGNGCTVGYDAITNKYVAMLDDGTGQVSNVYTKEEVNTLVDGLQSQIDSNDTDIENINTNIKNLQESLNNYALKTELEETNSNLDALTEFVNTNTDNIDKNTDVISEIQNSLGNYALQSNLDALNNRDNIGSLLFRTTDGSGYTGDVNNIIEPGMYKELISPSASNSPGYYAYLLVFKYYGTSNVTQVAFGYNENKISMRYYYGGRGWSNWVEK